MIYKFVRLEWKIIEKTSNKLLEFYKIKKWKKKIFKQTLLVLEQTPEL